MSRKLQDHFFRKAKEAGFLARSAYKLSEIQQRFRVVPRDGNVLDLGCSPGAWLQVASQATTGRLVGVDIKGVCLPPSLVQRGVSFVQTDVTTLRDDSFSHLCLGFDAVLSDLCHSTIGNAAADAARSLSLGETAAALSLGSEFDLQGNTGAPDCNIRHGVLVPGGNLVIKLLEGAGIVDFTSQLRRCFAKVRHVRPAATRRQSREVFLICLHRLGPWTDP